MTTMPRRLSVVIPAVMMLAAFSPQAAAQGTSLPFSIRTQQGTTVQIISDGGTFALPSEGIGLPLDGQVTINYTRAASASISSIDLSGSTEFALVSPPPIPIVVSPRTPSFGFNVRYTPITSKMATGKITVNFVEDGRPGSFVINLVGTAPEFAYTYQVLPDGNTNLLSAGGTIRFPPSNIDETTTAQIAITNKGSGPGVVNGIMYSGSPRIALAGIPFPPATIEASKDLRFSLRFTPAELEPVAGKLQIDLVANRSVTFDVAGSGLGPVLTYELPDSGGAVAPGQVIRLPEATFGGEQTSTLMRFKNSGNADARISTISIAGSGFSLADVPFLPLTLKPGSIASVRVQFNPVQPGKATGRLLVGSDTFDVEANALGPSLSYSYSAGGSPVNIQNNGTVVFTPTAVGQTSGVQFLVKNDGTAPAEINSISVAGSGTTFALADTPSLPVSIPPGATIPVSINFTPATTGNLTGTLRIDTQSFTLSGAANPPQPLSDYSFQGASGAIQPSQQTSVGVSLSKSHPLEIRGTLAMKFNSDVFADDPSVQFAVGGRSASFSIPAGETDAVFANGSKRIGIQGGTVAGTISLTPSFATVSGIDLTPQNAASLNLTVPPAAPKLLSVVLSSKSSNGFTLLITGFATTRSVTQIDFQFAAVQGETLGTSRLSLNVEPSFAAWYQSQQSQQYGSLFTATVPFTLQGDLKNASTVVDAIQSVSVTLANRQGTSEAQSVALR